MTHYSPERKWFHNFGKSCLHTDSLTLGKRAQIKTDRLYWKQAQNLVINENDRYLPPLLSVNFCVISSCYHHIQTYFFESLFLVAISTFEPVKWINPLFEYSVFLISLGTVSTKFATQLSLRSRKNAIDCKHVKFVPQPVNPKTMSSVRGLPDPGFHSNIPIFECMVQTSFFIVSTIMQGGTFNLSGFCHVSVAYFILL